MSSQSGNGETAWEEWVRSSTRVQGTPSLIPPICMYRRFWSYSQRGISDQPYRQVPDLWRVLGDIALENFPDFSLDRTNTEVGWVPKA